MYKIWRSYQSFYAGAASNTPDELTDETVTADGVYTDLELQRIADAGFNAVWLHGLLHHIVRTAPYPELGVNAEYHVIRVNRLIERAAKYGLKVFLYLQPPRAVERGNTVFWDNHFEDGGINVDFYNGAKVRTFCTSVPSVKKWIADASEQVAKSMPELAGIILITNGEFPSHCLNSNNNAKEICPRCAERPLAEVIAEIINMVREGVRRQSKKMEVIAWNWAWEYTDAESVISQLPEDIIIMNDFERDGYMDLPDYPHFHFMEYSLAYPGPCDSYLRTKDILCHYPHRLMAKLQLGTTHELATIPCLTAVYSIFHKAAYLKKNPPAGFLGCWNFGNLPGSNIEAFHFFLMGKDFDNEETAVKAFAAFRFPKADPKILISAWKKFRNALLYFPNVYTVLYYGPQNFTLGYTAIYKTAPLEGVPAGRSWHLDPRGDDFNQMLDQDVFTLDQIIERFEKLSGLWNIAVIELTKALCDDKYPSELRNAKVAGAAFTSTFNTLRIYRMRKNWNNSCLHEFLDIANAEKTLLESILPDVEADQWIGYHAEPHGWLFDAESIREKIAFLKKFSEVK